MANSIQQLIGGILFLPFIQMDGEDTAAALAFGDAVDAVPPIPRTADASAVVVNAAAPEQLAADPVPTGAIIPVVPAADVLVGVAVQSETLQATAADDANAPVETSDDEPVSAAAGTVALPAVTPNEIPIQFHGQVPPTSDQGPERGTSETRILASGSFIGARETPVAGKRTAGPIVPLGHANQPSLPLQLINVPVPTAALGQPNLAQLPDGALPVHKQELALNGFAKDGMPALPLPPPLSEVIVPDPALAPQRQGGTNKAPDELAPASTYASGQADRNPLATLFASVPQLAPRMIYAPVTAKGDLDNAGLPVADEAVLAPAPIVAKPLNATPLPALQTPPPTDTTQAAGPVEADETLLPMPDDNLVPPTDGKALLQIPLGAPLAIKGLPQGAVPVPMAALPQIVARIASSDNPQPVGLQLDPIELGTVAFNMDTGPAGLVVTITAERPETLELLRRHADQFLSDLRQSGFQGASLQFGQSGNGQTGNGQTGNGQFGQGHSGQPRAQGHTAADYGATTELFETQSLAARLARSGALNLRL